MSRTRSMRCLPASASVWLLLALGSALAACSNDIDSLLCPPNCPVLPFKPDAARIDDCTACAEDSCVFEREACLGDPECAEVLQCRAKCWDPACLAKCGERACYANFECAEPGRLADLQYCIANGCGTECGWGDNWSCEGEYQWPAPARAPVEVEITGSGVGLPVRITACLTDTCAPDPNPTAHNAAASTVETDAWGQAEIDVYGGYFLVEASAVRNILASGAPFFRPTRYLAAVAGEGVVDALIPDRDRELGSLIVSASDCLGAMALGVTFEIQGDPEAMPSFYSTVTGGRAVAGTTSTSAEYPLGGFSDVMGGKLAVVARHAEGDRRVASKEEVVVRDGWHTSVSLVPIERGGE